MKFHLCKKCGIDKIKQGELLLYMQTQDKTWLCSWCEKRVGPDNPFDIIDIKIRRVCKGVYQVKE